MGIWGVKTWSIIIPFFIFLFFFVGSRVGGQKPVAQQRLHLENKSVPIKDLEENIAPKEAMKLTCDQMKFEKEKARQTMSIRVRHR